MYHNLQNRTTQCELLGGFFSVQKKNTCSDSAATIPSSFCFFLCCLSQHLEAFDPLPLYKAKQPPAITSTQLSVLQTYLAVASLASLQPAPPLGRQQEPPDLLFPSFLGSHGIAGLCGSMGCDLGHGDGFHHVGVQVEPSESERPAASGLPRPPSPRRDLAVLRAEPYL